MKPTILFVKNMVCHRCELTVESILDELNIPRLKVIIGEIHLEGELPEDKKAALASRFEEVGFELINSHLSTQIEKIKKYTLKKARNDVDEQEHKMKLSEYLSQKLNHEYTHLSSIFSSVEGRTIEKYFIEQRIEKAKELLIYGQLTLSQIAAELDYSSTAHLSTQFRKITGLTATYFKELGASKRKALDKV